MASVYPVIRLFITSYAKDFSKEREILLKEVRPVHYVKSSRSTDKIMMNYDEINLSIF